jgi:uncharacterized membrane protein YdcZ (DUF606 family)
MKTLSFIGTLLGIILLGTSIYNYNDLKDFLGRATWATSYYIFLPGLIGLYFFVFSLLVAKNHK